MRVTTRTFVGFATLLIVTAMTAHADTFTYSYYQDAGDYFSVTSPTALTVRTDFSTNIACSASYYTPCMLIQLDPVMGSAEWGAVLTAFSSYYEGVDIPVADFLAPGTYQVFGSPFSIVDNAASVTPEPSSLALLATGIAGLAGMIRRKCRAA